MTVLTRSQVLEAQDLGSRVKHNAYVQVNLTKSLQLSQCNIHDLSYIELQVANQTSQPSLWVINLLVKRSQWGADPVGEKSFITGVP